MARKSDPKTKEQLLDRMLSFDFDGDIRHLGVEPASIVRVSPNTLRLTFPDSGVTFELEVHRPREFSQAARSVAGEGRSFGRGSDGGSTEGLRRTQEPEPEAPRPRARSRSRRQPAQRTG